MNILLAIDGSDHSYDAVRAVEYLTRAASVTLIHVLDVPKPAYPLMMPEVARQLYVDLEQVMKEEGARLLDRTRSLLPLGSGPVATQLVVGSPADTIVAATESGQTDLIVMGTRGLGPIQERFLGSVSHRVLTAAPCAKFMVNRPIRSLELALLPLQGPQDAEAAVRFLQLKPFRASVKLHLFTVLPPTRPPWPADMATNEQLEQRALEAAQDFLNETNRDLATLGYEAKGTAVLGDPATAIMEQADKLRVDLILMGSRGRSGLTRFVLGSISHALLHQNRHPLLIVH